MVRQPYIALRGRRGHERQLTVVGLDSAGRGQWWLTERDGHRMIRSERVSRLRLQLMLGLGKRRRSARSLENAERLGVRY